MTWKICYSCSGNNHVSENLTAILQDNVPRLRVGCVNKWACWKNCELYICYNMACENCNSTILNKPHLKHMALITSYQHKPHLKHTALITSYQHKPHLKHMALITSYQQKPHGKHMASITSYQQKPHGKHMALITSY